MNDFERDTITDLVEHLEGYKANLAKDRGGWTYMGLSTRYYPEIKSLYDTGNLTRDFVYKVYLRDYLSTIPMYSQLSKTVPWLVKLIFFGKVHGTGDEQYTAKIQQFLNSIGSQSVKVDGIMGRKTASAVLELSQGEQDDLARYLIAHKSQLAASRVKSVGAYANGIRNRIETEFSLAFSDVRKGRVSPSGNQITKSVGLLASVTTLRDRPQVVGDWSLYKLGTSGINIQVKGKSNASNTIYARKCGQAT
jgi:lysozyme family protein